MYGVENDAHCLVKGSGFGTAGDPVALAVIYREEPAGVAMLKSDHPAGKGQAP